MEFNSLDDVKTYLSGKDGGVEAYDFVNTAILNERSTYKGRVSELQGKYGVLSNALSKLGYDSSNGQDLNAFVQGIVDKVAKVEDSGKKLSASEQREAERDSKIADLSNRFEQSQTELTAERAKTTNALMKGDLLKAFNGKLFSAEIHAKDLIRENKVKLKDGKTVFIDGENEIAFDTGVSGYIEANSESKINQQKGGAGSSGSSGGSSQNKVVAESAFNNMSYSERDVFIKDGGTVKDD